MWIRIVPPPDVCAKMEGDIPWRACLARVECIVCEGTFSKSYRTSAISWEASVRIVAMPLLVKQEYVFLERECKNLRVVLSSVCLSLKKWDRTFARLGERTEAISAQRLGP